jgi:SMP-30/Gluconolactonase/LRE-like region
VNRFHLNRRRMLRLTAGGLAFAAGADSAMAAQGRVIERLSNDGPMPPGPYPRIEKLDPALDAVLTGEPPQILATGLGNGGGCEGPLWWKEAGYLLFCESGQRGKYTPGQGISVADPMARNGALTRDPQGRLVVTEGQARRVTRTEPEGRVTVVAAMFEGKPLNSPNDLVVHSDGSIYFTDPTFMPKDLGFNATYRVSPDLKRIDMLVDTLDFPTALRSRRMRRRSTSPTGSIFRSRRSMSCRVGCSTGNPSGSRPMYTENHRAARTDSRSIRPAISTPADRVGRSLSARRASIWGG